MSKKSIKQAVEEAKASLLIEGLEMPSNVQKMIEKKLSGETGEEEFKKAMLGGI